MTLHEKAYLGCLVLMFLFAVWLYVKSVRLKKEATDGCPHDWFIDNFKHKVRYCRKCTATEKHDTSLNVWQPISFEQFNREKSIYSTYEQKKA